jgi:hypothetical protein
MKNILPFNFLMHLASNKPETKTKPFKYLSLLVMLIMLGVNGVMGQTTIYSTNFGTTTVTSSSTFVAGWTSPNYQTGGTNPKNMSISTSSVSDTYSTPITASGGANLADGSSSPSSGTATATLAGQVNTTGYTTIELAFGYRATASYSATVTLDWSPDGSTWNSVSLGTLTRDGSWRAINGSNWLSLPSGAENQSNLRFRFTFVRANTSGNFRIDDFTVRGTATPSIAISNGTIAAGTPNNGQTNVVLQRYDMAVTTANATLTGLTVTTAGTYAAADLSNLKCWYQSSSTFNSGTATLLSTKTTSLSSGSQVFPSFTSQAITSGSTGYIFVTADIASGATNGNTINIGTTAFSNITFSSGTKTGTDPVPAGGAQTITVATPSIAVSANHPIVGTINQNSTNQNIASLAFAVSNANATLNSVSFTTAGTYQTSDLVASSFKLYYTTTNTFATTSPLGSAQAVVASGNTITFSGLSQSITSGTTGYVWLSVDVAYNANTSRNISVTSTAFSNITFATGTLTGTDPVGASNVQTFGNVTPSIAIAQNGPTASNVNLSTTNAILYGLSFAVTGNTTDFNSLTVTTGGTYQTSDLVASSFKLYYTTTNSFSSATQLSTSQAIVTSGNNVVFSGINQNILIGTTGYLWVTVDIDAAAVAARTINITSTTFTNITFAAGNKTGTDPASAGGTRTITAAPSMTELVVPQFIGSKTAAGTNNARTPIAICLQFDNLAASQTYDIGLQLELNGAGVTSFGAGNLWNGTEFSNSTLTNAFTTNGSGSSGPVWFYIAPTGNGTRFDAAQIHNVRVKYVTAGGSLTDAPNFIGTKTITALDIASSARTLGTTDDGAFITGTLPTQTSGKFVLLYTNETGTGDPIYSYQAIASTAFNATTQSELPTAINNIFLRSGTSNGQFAGVVPIGANNANGIRRIEVRNADNTVFAAYSTSDGKWGSSADFTTLTRRSVGTIDYTNVNNLSLNGSITLAVATSVFGLVTVQNSATLTTGDNLTLKSNASGTASIGSLASGTITGNVTVERYLPARRAWRLLTAPLKGNTNNSIYANWQGVNDEGVLLWHPNGNGTNGLSVGPQANIWSYSNGWNAVSNTNSSLLFSTRNNAFLVYATGPSNSTNIASNTAASITTLRPKGELITGTVNYTGLTADQFHLLGNPYASPIDLARLRTSNASYTFYLLDPSLGDANSRGGYYTYNGSWAPNIPSNELIQSGQGFFVKSASATTFDVLESHKDSGNSNIWFDRTSADTSVDKIRVLLYKQDNSAWYLADGILAVNSASGNHEVDAADADKMTNFNENLLFKNGASNLAIEYRGLPAAGTLQPLQLTGTSAQGYELRIHTENYSNSNLTPYLENTQTGVLTEIPTDGSEVIVPFTGIAATSAAPDSRFRIVYQSPLSADDLNSLVVGVYPNPVHESLFTVELANTNAPARYSLTNLLGQVVQEGSLVSLTNAIPVHDLSEGVYLLQVNQEGKRFTTKLMIK